MKNLDQIRAAHALNAASGKTFKGANDGEVVKKIPAMIRQNGLLGALAFAKEKGDKSGHSGVFLAIIAHLSNLGKLPGQRRETLEGFIADLGDADSAKLRSVTDEAMAYLNYLRRFAEKGGGDDSDRD